MSQSEEFETIANLRSWDEANALIDNIPSHLIEGACVKAKNAHQAEGIFAGFLHVARTAYANAHFAMCEELLRLGYLFARLNPEFIEQGTMCRYVEMVRAFEFTQSFMLRLPGFAEAMTCEMEFFRNSKTHIYAYRLARMAGEYDPEGASQVFRACESMGSLQGGMMPA